MKLTTSAVRPRHTTRFPGLALAALIAVTGCSAKDDKPAPVGDGGPQLSISVAPLDLPGVSDVRWRLTVDNAASEQVWQRTLTSGQYGDGRGSVSYVGPCDADSNPNTATLELLALVDRSGADVPIDDYINPTPVSREVACLPSEDVKVDFDLTVARRANQGFFDVAVSFDDIFCSAKLDCVRDDTGQPIELLFNDDGERDTTVIVAFACTTGQGSATYLHMDALRLTCTDGSEHLLDPSQGPGDVGGTAPYVFQRATYMTQEQLPGYDKCSWNTAVGLDTDAIPAGVDCALSGLGSASAAAWDAGQSPEAIWPVIDWNVTVVVDGALACTQHPLGGADGGVETTYTGFSGHRFGFSMACTPSAGNAPRAVPNGTVCDGVATGVDDSVVFVNTADGVIVTAGDDTSEPTPLPEGWSLLEECCLDPCCAE